MTTILNAVMPVILLMILGNILRRTDFIEISFWRISDKLTYFVLFPSMLITKIAHVDTSKFELGKLSLFLAIYFVIVIVAVFLVYRLCKGRKGQFSSLFQGMLRFNTYIFFAIIAAVWDNTVVGLSALFAALVIPLLNTCCIASFAMDGKTFSFLSTLKNIGKNPLILACLVGFIVNQLPVLMPTVLFNTMSVLATAALPLALLSIGASVRVKLMFRKNPSFSLTLLYANTLARLVLIPAIAYLLGRLIGLDNTMQIIVVMFAAVPTATSSYILSVQLGGDDVLMTTIISVQTILSLVTLTLWLILLV